MTATIYVTMWDYYMDWGLIRSFEKANFLLRPQHSFSPSFYYFAMGTNFILRFYWLITIYTFPSLEKFDLIVLSALLAESVRRTLWSIIRVENEFYNNFESYRTIPNIPSLMDDVRGTLE